MNQDPEQLTHDKIAAESIQCAWFIQNKDQVDHNAGLGIAVKKYQTGTGGANSSVKTPYGKSTFFTSFIR